MAVVFSWLVSTLPGVLVAAAPPCQLDLEAALDRSDAAVIATFRGCPERADRHCLVITEILGSKVRLNTVDVLPIVNEACVPDRESSLQGIESVVAIIAISVPQSEDADPRSPAVEILRTEEVGQAKRIGAKIFWPGTWLAGGSGGPRIHLGTTDIYHAWQGFEAYLRHFDSGMRASAARALSVLGYHAEPAIPSLLASLDDPVAEVRAAAAKALIELGATSNPSTLQPFRVTRDHLTIEATLLSESKVESIRDFDPKTNRLVVQPGASLELLVEIDSWFGRPYPHELGLDIQQPLAIIVPCASVSDCPYARPVSRNRLLIGEHAEPRPELEIELDTHRSNSEWTFHLPNPPPGQLRAEIVDWGIFGNMRVIGSRPGNATSVDTGALSDVHVIDELESSHSTLQTTDIDASLGTRFGIRFVVDGPEDPLPVLIRVHHPEFRGRTIEEWPQQADLGIPRYTGWNFDHDWELVGGKWRFEIIYQGESLAAKTFTVHID